MRTKAMVHKKRMQGVIYSHIKAKLGSSLFASEKTLDIFTKENPTADRVSGAVKYKDGEH